MTEQTAFQQRLYLSQETQTLISNSLQEASQRLSPLWDVRDYVAVNPFFGFRNKNFIEVAQYFDKISKNGILPKKEYFLKKYRSGEVTTSDLHQALQYFRKEHKLSENFQFQMSDVLSFIESQNNQNRDSKSFCLSELYDHQYQSKMTKFISKEVSRWSSAYFDEAQAVWRIPRKDLRLYAWWRSLAQYDAPFGKNKNQFMTIVRSLPQDPLEAIYLLTESLFKQVRLDAQRLADYYYGLIYSVLGWASHMQRFEFEALRTGDGTKLHRVGGLMDLLALRMAYDLSLLSKDLNVAALAKYELCNIREVEYGCIWLMATEMAYRRSVENAIKQMTPSIQVSQTPSIQAVFCIDVRSEILRRNLENRSPQVQTLGFAGFFALPISLKGLGHQESDQNCPVLLNTNFELKETAGGNTELFKKKKINFAHGAYLRKTIQSSANSGFSFMETMGFGYIGKMLKSSLGQKPNLDLAALGLTAGERRMIRLNSDEMSLDSKVNLAFGALKNMGLKKDFAKYVFFFGHGSESANNPYAAALDCGACAGHNGQGNAHVLATILNEQIVRNELLKKSVEIPAQTIFLSGWHNTTKDKLLIDETSQLTEAQKHDLQSIYKIFDEASRDCQKERAQKLPLCSDLSEEDLQQELKIRANDWSEIRPEWGLARNACFIVGRRELTRGVNLDGRAFLHDYDAKKDQDLSILELIMTAPMIVTNWINMQYYASTVDPHKFGAGNKVLNNVVGGIGCVQGNESDLLGGLAEQSVWYKGDYFHEPLRLQVFIEAEPEAIDQIIQKHQMVRELISNHWLNVISIHPSHREFKVYHLGTWLNTKEDLWN